LENFNKIGECCRSMQVIFQSWSADDLINAYVQFVKRKKSKEVFIDYVSNKYGFKETMKGMLELSDPRLKELAKKVQFTDTRHYLELFQKNWKITFHLSVVWDPGNDYGNTAKLSFDDLLKKEVMKHFKQFDPE